VKTQGDLPVLDEQRIGLAVSARPDRLDSVTHVEPKKKRPGLPTAFQDQTRWRRDAFAAFALIPMT
jgi:hypothetical protein